MSVQATLATCRAMRLRRGRGDFARSRQADGPCGAGRWRSGAVHQPDPPVTSSTSGARLFANGLAANLKPSRSSWQERDKKSCRGTDAGRGGQHAANYARPRNEIAAHRYIEAQRQRPEITFLAVFDKDSRYVAFSRMRRTRSRSDGSSPAPGADSGTAVWWRMSRRSNS